MVSRHKSLLTQDLIVPKLQNIDTAPPATRTSCTQSYIPMRLVHCLMSDGKLLVAGSVERERFVYKGQEGGAGEAYFRCKVTDNKHLIPR